MIMQWLGSLFARKPQDWDAYEAQLVADGWTPDRARADRMEEEFPSGADA